MACALSHRLQFRMGLRSVSGDPIVWCKASLEAGTCPRSRDLHNQHRPTQALQEEGRETLISSWLGRGGALAMSSEVGLRRWTGSSRAEGVTSHHFVLQPSFILMMPLVGQGQICCVHPTPGMAAFFKIFQGLPCLSHGR